MRIYADELKIAKSEILPESFRTLTIGLMTRREIEAIAESIAVIYNPESLAPFPYENIVDDKHDLNVTFLDLDDSKIPGVVLYDESKKFNILINSEQAKQHQHFTLGHELGHYFLHQDILMSEGGFIDNEKSIDASNQVPGVDDTLHDELEIEANHFATYLIMPTRLVEDAWGVFHDIEECARIFNVSAVVMSIRLTELGFVS